MGAYMHVYQVPWNVASCLCRRLRGVDEGTIEGGALETLGEKASRDQISPRICFGETKTESQKFGVSLKAQRKFQNSDIIMDLPT